MMASMPASNTAMQRLEDGLLGTARNQNYAGACS